MTAALPALAADTKLSDPDYVGAKVCADCHQHEYRQWQGSHHDQAMQHVSDDSVLGDFANARFEYNGVTSTFYRKGREFWVQTDGPDGKLTDYKIDFVFGVAPLQQYLIGFDDGRYQALSISWDSRPAAEGGQRWFHLYPQETIDHNDVLHWTRFSQNWNSRCAECHSTNLHKRYDQLADRYATQWSEINVACEACHGPGRSHVEWSKKPDSSVAAKELKRLEALEGTKGLKGLQRDISGAGEWNRLPGMATATLTAQRKLDHRQVNACGQCHSRRAVLADPVFPSGEGAAFSTQLLDTHLVSMLEPGLYHADGQILDEVYVYGSFMQSKMYQRGVVCSDCHNPHSLALKAPGNQVCAQCHNPSQFAATSHHHHPQESSGAQCVNCHMPETTYMVVDPRRDHSLRIPRPDLSTALGTPNACTQCHQDESVEWAAEQFSRWYPKRAAMAHYGASFHLAAQGGAQSIPQLAALANDVSRPEIVRASALNRLGDFSNTYTFNTALTLLDSPEPLMRIAALRAFESADLQQRMMHLWPLLNDPVKAVRLEATRLLAGVGLRQAGRVALTDDLQARLDSALDEYIVSIQANADAPPGQLQLGVLYQAQGRTNDAEQAYLHALRLERDYIPAMLNLADLYRASHQDSRAGEYLQRALVVDPDNVAANYSSGLLYIRLKQLDKAVTYLRKAAGLAPEVSHYSYVYAVALYESGKAEWAISTLKQTLQRHPGNRDILSALVSYLSALGRTEEAQRYAQQLRQ